MKITLSIIITLLTIASAIGCVVFRTKGNSFAGMLCKFSASIGFISLALVGYYCNPVNSAYFVMICFALLFGLGGDVLLGIKEIAPTFRSKLILFGTVSFLIGHFFFIAAFATIGSFGLINIIIGVGGAIIGFAIIKLIKADIKGKFLIIMPIYYGILFMKTSVAFSAVSSNFSVSVILNIISCILFIISDTCLGFIYFTPLKRKNTLVTVELATYYPAQILPALGILLLTA